VNSAARAPDADRTARWRPRVTGIRPAVDPVAAEAAAARLLTALGLDLADENLAETPRRMASALIEMTSGPDFELSHPPSSTPTARTCLPTCRADRRQPAAGPPAPAGSPVRPSSCAAATSPARTITASGTVS
jgi:GTP cyclohydrolase I